jgi:methionyl-tRNA formyltransferase
MLRLDRHVDAIDRYMASLAECETRLRLVRPDDAAYILRLRTDPAKGKNLSATENSLEFQLAWLRGYQSRHAAGREAYFIVEHAGKACGTIRLYDYRPAEGSFCWGSWIIESGMPAVVAIRSALLIYDLAFGPLGFVRSHFSVRQANTSVWRFHERMGAALSGEDDLDRSYLYSAEDYQRKRCELEKHTQGRPRVRGRPKICISGKSDIASDCLLGLLKRGYAPDEICVVANKSDTGKHAWQKSLVATARVNGIPIWPVADVQQLPEVRFFSLEHDRILRPALFKSPHLYNLHFSKLPAYRGVATSVWPLRNQEKESGVTLHRIDDGIDTGPVVAQTAFSLGPGLTAAGLYQEYMRHGRALFFETLDSLMDGVPVCRAQEGEPSYYPRSAIDYGDLEVGFSRDSASFVAEMKSRIFWQYQLPVFQGRRVWDVHLDSPAETLGPGEARELDGWTALVGTLDGAVRIDYCLLDALISWAQGGAAPASYPKTLPDLQTENATGWTPLMIASFNGQLPAMRWLLDAGADVNHQNRRGTSSLMYAKSRAQSTGDLEPLRLLLGAGASVTAQDQYGMTVSDYCDPDADTEILALLKS